MGITSPEKIAEMVRTIHDEFIAKLMTQHTEKRQRIDDMLKLEKLRRSMESVLDRQIQRTAKGALKEHLQALEAGEGRDPFLNVTINVKELGKGTWNSTKSPGIKKSYSHEDLAWGFALLLEGAGYVVDQEGIVELDIPLTDEAEQALDEDDEQDEELDEDDEGLIALEDAIDQDLQGPTGDEEDGDDEDDEEPIA